MKFLCKVSFVVMLAFMFCISSAGASEVLRISSTIGPVDADMLPLLAQEFTKKTGIEITLEKAGTGKTLEKAKTGNFDLVMVHARKLEDAFCAEGYGVDRRDVMYNDFLFLDLRMTRQALRVWKK